jgi:hypothetical protein
LNPSVFSHVSCMPISLPHERLLLPHPGPLPKEREDHRPRRDPTEAPTGSKSTVGKSPPWGENSPNKCSRIEPTEPHKDKVRVRRSLTRPRWKTVHGDGRVEILRTRIRTLPPLNQKEGLGVHRGKSKNIMVKKAEKGVNKCNLFGRKVRGAWGPIRQLTVRGPGCGARHDPHEAGTVVRAPATRWPLSVD